MAPATGVHYHRSDYPRTLALLAELTYSRLQRGEVAGFERTSHGAWVDWDELIGGTWSTSEIGVLLIAHGCSVLEFTGGAGPLAVAVVEAIGRVA